MADETIETITKSYEEKLKKQEEDFKKEKEDLIKTFQEEKKKEIDELTKKHHKEIADYILGRKVISENKEETEKENDEKSFFDKAVEDTKKKLKEV